MGWKDYIPFMPKDTPKDTKPKLKICCACPETKAARDECIAMNGEEDPKCQKLIEAHKVCLKAEGFNV